MAACGSTRDKVVHPAENKDASLRLAAHREAACFLQRFICPPNISDVLFPAWIRAMIAAWEERTGGIKFFAGLAPSLFFHPSI